MSLIGKLLPATNVALDLQVSSKKRLFEQAGLLFENQHGLARSVVFDSLFARERLGSTGLGQGVAIPHGRIKGLKDALCAFFRLAQPVPFDAPDANPVALACVLLVPEQATEKHLQILSELAQMFSDKALREAMIQAPDAAALIVADGITPPQALVDAATHSHTPLLSSPLPAARVIEKLARYLAKALAEKTERHGVLMDVLGLGVLITGESGVGKSELGLELISRGHGLVADDIVEISRIAANTLEGRCPPMLRDFLEVRGLGLLNIRTIFGETAVRPKMKLKLVAHLERPGGRESAERLPLADVSEDILGIT